MSEKPNTFAELEKKTAPNSEAETPAQPVKEITPRAKPQEAAATAGEIKVDDFSDTAVGDKVKYIRPELNGKEDVIDKFQVFKPNTNDELQTSQSGTSKYWKATQILSYGSKNEQGVQNREYISGAVAFQQKDGSPSDVSFWYDGCAHQSGMIWEMVAKHLGVEPKALSPRQYIAFLNSKPKVVIKAMQYKNFGAPANAPKTVSKNMPGVFQK